jgi:photosystem II stability/assembly factor-like uncharacterized protein
MKTIDLIRSITTPAHMAAAGIFLLLFPLALIVLVHKPHPHGATYKEEEFPSDWFYRQRAYPQGEISQDLRKSSLEQALRLQRASAALRSLPRTGAAAWRASGPSNIGGRITTLAVSRQHPDLIYVGAADGGVLRSTNGGVNWTPLFDDQPSLSIGALALDPLDDNTVYVGTGEANSSGDSYDGFGMVKSTNGGLTWFPLGLEGTRHIGRIVIDPSNSNTIYVAAMGALYSATQERGVFRSTDAGATWSRVLHVNDSTGAIDIAIHPRSPSILLAAMWQRMRGPQGRLYVGGPGTGIYRSTDAGTSWLRLTNGLPLPSATVGRPSIALAPSNPSVGYVSYADDPGNFAGVYTTTNGGDSWARTSDAALSGLYSDFGWYFGNVCVHPTDENTVYVLGVLLAISRNGGMNWTIVAPPHVDQHALAFHPTDPSRVFIGNDGGFCTSTDDGFTWFQPPNRDLYITQFYAGCINPLNPWGSMGGTQDNGTVRTQAGLQFDWEMVNGGDGFYCVIDYADTNYQYAEYQWGSIVRTTDGWRSTSYSATAGIDPTDRHNWSTPIVMDPQNPRVLYTGSQRLYRTTDRAVTWKAISPDLSNGYVPRFGGYATITTIDAAPSDSATILAGTDDGNVWVTTDRGLGWRKISGTLPNRWITRVRFDHNRRNTAYVTLSGYKIESKLSHVFRTTDLGESWQDISGNLPEAPVNVILVDPVYPERLYVGTDVGAFYTADTGITWNAMGIGLPRSSINDMDLHPGSRIVRAFTHGRSAWELDLDELLTTPVADHEQLASRFHLSSNYPNPFNPSTTLDISLPGQADLTVTIYDLQGRAIWERDYPRLSAGTHRFEWNGTNGMGVPVASGIYLCRVRAEGNAETRRVVLVR